MSIHRNYTIPYTGDGFSGGITSKCSVTYLTHISENSFHSATNNGANISTTRMLTLLLHIYHHHTYDND